MGSDCIQKNKQNKKNVKATFILCPDVRNTRHSFQSGNFQENHRHLVAPNRNLIVNSWWNRVYPGPRGLIWPGGFR